jgi:hypothetical protein
MLTVVLAICFLLSTAQAGTVSENFDNNQFNPVLFSIYIAGTGPSVAVANKHLEITLPSDSVTEPSGSYGGYLASQFHVTGDYDAQVDFNLLTWPTYNGGAGIYANNCEVSRRNFGSEVYEAWLDGVEFRVNATDSTGTLRLKKTGNTIQAFYRNAAGWQLIGSSNNPQFEQPSGISIGAVNYPHQFARQNLKVAFDNLKIVTSSGNGSTAGIVLLLMD